MSTYAMASWEYDRGNRVHHGPGDLRRLSARI